MNEKFAMNSSQGKARRRQEPRKSIYDQQREVAIIKNARKRGYLRRMTIEVFNESTGLNDRDLPTLTYLNMTSSQLSSVGVLAKCVNLRICILPGNYITNFEPLINCVHLTVLDLHSNQIKNIPGNHFWAALNKLQILYLHDNSLSSLQTIHFLSSSTSIIALTLYDTPLSLKKNYRHHLVNGLWSLKALDGYVISDEEIIEDISTCGMFSAKNENLKVYTEHRLSKDSSMKKATLHFENVIKNINKVQAKYCPVVIIQKVARGYLARKYYKHLLEMRVWAATTIQRCYRYHRGLTRARSNPLPPPPSTPFLSGQTGRSSCAELEQEKSMVAEEQYERDSSLENQNSSITQDLSRISVGRELSYLPGQLSKLSNLSQMSSNLSKIHENSFIEEILSKVYTESSVLEKTMSAADKETSDKSLINYDISSLANSKPSSTLSNNNSWKRDQKDLSLLSMLEVDKWDKILTQEDKKDAEDEKKSCRLMKKKKPKRVISSKKKEKSVIFKNESAKDEEFFLRKSRLKPEMVGKYQTVRVFLGSMLEKAVEIDEEKAGGILLSGDLPPKQKNDPLVEMYLSKKEMAEDTRRCLRETKYRLQKQVKKEIMKQDKTTTEKQLFLRTHGTMSLSCLRAVHQAYKDRKDAQELVDKAAIIAQIKERRDEITNRLQTLRHDYHEHIFTSRIQDGVNIADALKINETKQERLLKKVAARRLEKTSKVEQHKADMKFIKHFSSQQTSVSKALRGHDQAELNKQNLEKLTNMVNRIRESNLRQKALVRRYLEHSQLVKQTETAHTKAKLEKFLAAEDEQRNLAAQTRVTESKKEITKHFHPLCPINVPISNMSLSVASLQETTNESSGLHTFSSFTETSTSNDQLLL